MSTVKGYSVNHHTDILPLLRRVAVSRYPSRIHADLIHALFDLWRASLDYANLVIGRFHGNCDLGPKGLCLCIYCPWTQSRFGVSDIRRFIPIMREDVESATEERRSKQLILSELTKSMHAVEAFRTECILNHHVDPQCMPSHTHILDLVTSDSCSDAEDTRHCELRLRLELFRLDDTKLHFQTEPDQPRRIRKDIRAWARFAGFGSMKLSDDSMLLHKDRYRLPPRRRVDKWAYRETKISNGYSSAESGGSLGSTGTGSSNKKRRLPKEEGAYICDFKDCTKRFDRQCDLNHHQRSHIPKDTQPYPCTQCTKRFGYAKDLRRHEKTHRKGDVYKASLEDDIAESERMCEDEVVHEELADFMNWLETSYPNSVS